jgi:hypothetical protein
VDGGVIPIEPSFPMLASHPTATRCLNATTSLLLRVLRHARFLHSADAGAVWDRRTPQMLNLPGALPFYPERMTDVAEVRQLLHTLRPRIGGPPLIRFGPRGDGGYLIPDDLSGVVACFSPGVNTVAGFELDCAQRGMDVYLADASVAAPPQTHPRFHFRRNFIGAVTRDNFLTLEDWVDSAIGDRPGDLMLQMDIEGYEYESLLSAPKSLLERFRIVVVEFHELDRLFSVAGYRYYASVFAKLLQSFVCVHVHPNNVCPTLTVKGLEILQMAELTFLRRDRVTDWRFATAFPHPLDCDNTSKTAVVVPSVFRGTPATAWLP